MSEACNCPSGCATTGPILRHPRSPKARDCEHPQLNGISSETVATRRLPNYGSKMGIDATRKWKAEGFERPWPAMIEMDRGTKARVDALWEKLGL